ncbi:MAG: hypothetical protein ACRCYU_14905 [Nocardioides sp.]
MTAPVDLDAVARALGVATDARLVEEVSARRLAMDSQHSMLVFWRSQVCGVSSDAADALTQACSRVLDAYAALDVVVRAAESHERGVR